MRSKSPFRQDKCAEAWKAWEAPYLKKPGGKEEARREKGEFYCDAMIGGSGKIKLRPSDDSDTPMTDAQIKERHAKKQEKKD